MGLNATSSETSSAKTGLFPCPDSFTQLSFVVIISLGGGEWQSVCCNRHVVVQWAQGGCPQIICLAQQTPSPMESSHRSFTLPHPRWVFALVPLCLAHFPSRTHAEVLRRKGCFCFAFTLCPTAQRGASYLVSTQKYL